MVVDDCVSGVLPYPSRLSTPVTLTLALSRRAGEGIRPIASPGFAKVSPRGSFAQPVSTGIVGVCRSAIPLCPSDISPASGGNPGVLQRSRRAGEGERVAALHGFAKVSLSRELQGCTRIL